MFNFKNVSINRDGQLINIPISANGKSRVIEAAGEKESKTLFAEFLRLSLVFQKTLFVNNRTRVKDRIVQINQTEIKYHDQISNTLIYKSQTF